MLASIAIRAALLAGSFWIQPVQLADDPTIRTAVERYYQAIEAEDIDAYLALWSKTVEQPQRQSLEYLFRAFDDRFFDIEITRTALAGDRLRVRLSLRRERSRPALVAGAQPVVQSETDHAALTFVKEGGEWKVVSEGSPAADLAAALAAASTADEREALLAAEPDLVGRSLVVALARIASAAAMQQNHARAQVLFERVLELARRTKSRKEEGETLQNLGNTFYFQRKFPEALALYEERLVLERERGDDAALAAALAGAATIRYSLAEYTEALKQYRLALAIHERLDDRASTASALISTGNVRYLQGDYSGAIRDYTRSRDLYRSFAYTDGEARALEGLGRTYAAQGDYAAAVTAYSGVLAEGRARNNRARQGSATQSLGDIHLRLGNADAARKFYEESRDHHLAQKDLSGAGRVWQGLGMTELIAGRVETAEQAYTRSAAICGGVSDAECVAHALVGLGFAQSAQEKYQDAVASYQKGIDGFAALGNREAAARGEIGLSQAFAGIKSFAAALAASERARHAAIALNNDDVLWRALTADARALRKRGEGAQALAAARAAVGVVERMQEAALRKPATTIPSDAEAAFATLAVLQAEAGDSAGAWSSTTRMRALHLRTMLAVNEREIARGMTDEEREKERAMASELLSLFAQAARQRALPKPDKERIAALEGRIAAATAARNEWMDALYARLPDLRVWRGLIPSPPDEEVASVLTPGTVLLDLVVDDEDVAVVVVSANPEISIAAYTSAIRRRTLAERVNALLQGQTVRDVALWRKAAQEIAQVLPAALWKTLETATKVVVLPHDILWRVPFEALPLGDGYLGDRAQVVYSGSRAALVRAVAGSAQPVKTMFAVAAPDISAAMKERLQQTAPGWTIRAGETAAHEAQTVSAIFGDSGTVLMSGEATKAALISRASNVSEVHIASPFRINGASPLFSPILVTGDGSAESGDSESLELREVMNLTMQPRVVLLTDGAATSMRDGAAGADVVQWAWLAGGAPSVILARWSADPEASEALLAEFHRQLLKGIEAAEALQAARAAVRKRPEWAAPFFWAGWMGLGR
ncbi:MAG: CHAT domain-containing tetratricopeptide repeat protein [Vicinamibacterales bacterium]